MNAAVRLPGLSGGFFRAGTYPALQYAAKGNKVVMGILGGENGTYFDVIYMHTHIMQESHMCESELYNQPPISATIRRDNTCILVNLEVC
ncbi:hypothetical protein LSTR_LSTR016656 [Laodelphax striatellus]|nr:hypothetical protein LSTR_LSTR016656 [Laodelphax striatellus]